jgi:GNAT superfamily N-acetyltransferase
MPRIRMSMEIAPQQFQARWPSRLVHSDDLPQLAVLMLESYRGTIDDGGETINDAMAEVEGTFAGKYGELLGSCSFVITENERICSASLVTLFEALPLLAFSITHPTCSRRGMASQLIQESINAIHDRGNSRLRLVVTEGNTPARRLYHKLGFLSE